MASIRLLFAPWNILFCRRNASVFSSPSAHIVQFAGCLPGSHRKFINLRSGFGLLPL